MLLIHRFLPGLRFDSAWSYQARSPSGRKYWTPLPMSAPDMSGRDTHGAWWCALRCAAVMGLRPWDSLSLRGGLPPCPLPEEIADALRLMLPGWRVQAEDDMQQAPVERCARAVEKGGTALVRLRSLEGGDAGQGEVRDEARGEVRDEVRSAADSYGIRWAWVTGVEMQVYAPNDLSSVAMLLPAPRLYAHPRSLLVAPFGHSQAPSCGYGARVAMEGNGLCKVHAMDSQRFDDTFLQIVTMEPQ